MTPLLIGALSAGIVGSPHCIGMCGGFAAACSERVSDAAAYHVGRLLTYGTLGAAAGWIGGAIPGPGWFPAVVAGILLVGFSARLAGLLPEMHIKMPWLTRAGGALLGQKSLLGRGAFGALTGLLPCGLTWAALSMPVASGTAWSGALLMAAFWMGTVPLLAAASVGVRRFTATRLWARRLLAVGVLASGLYSIGMRQGMAAAIDAGETPSCHEE